MESIFKFKQSTTSSYNYEPIYNLVWYCNETQLDFPVTVGNFSYTHVGFYETPVAIQCCGWTFIMERMTIMGRTILIGQKCSSSTDPYYLCAIRDGYRYNAGGYEIPTDKLMDFMIDILVEVLWNHLTPLDKPTKVRLVNVKH